jgi:hypothetical protein
MIDLLYPIEALSRLFNTPNLGDTLEKYILSRHPKDATDVERLSIEWQRRQVSGWIK